MSTTKPIFEEDDEAAKLTTVTGWMSRDGIFYGQNERTARWSGSTHKRCNLCSAVLEKHSNCKDCRDINTRKSFMENTKEIEWDGTYPLTLFREYRFFMDQDDLFSYCINHKITPRDLLLVLCEPAKPLKLDILDMFEEHYNDGSGILPSEATYDALEELQRCVNADMKGVYYESSKRLNRESLDRLCTEFSTVAEI